MNRILKTSGLALLLSAGLQTLAAQGLLPADQPSSQRECVLCHVAWGADYYSELEKLLPELDHPVIISGQAGRVSGEDMCWSCHDGFVADSREFFLNDDAHNKHHKDWTESGKLPVDQNGDMYCGTCHTPHGQEMEFSYSFEPFLRQPLAESQVCLECHKDHLGGVGNHPLHVKMDTLPLGGLAMSAEPANQVECLSCHQMHQEESVLGRVGHDRSQLCSACHQEQMQLELSDHDLRVFHGEKEYRNEQAMAVQDACAACHSMHGGKAEGLWNAPLALGLAADSGLDARCLGCHAEGAVAAEKTWKSHGHPMDKPVKECTEAGLPLENGRMSCLSCHDPHRWSVTEEQAYLDRENEEGNAQSSFLRIPDDHEGRLCVACHVEQAVVRSSDHTMSTTLFSLSSPSQKGQCTACHTQHESAPFQGVQLGNTSSFTSLCLSCHEDAAAEALGSGGIGAHGHPYNVPTTKGAGLPGFSVASGDTLIGCETCHDPHRWSMNGVQWAGEYTNGGEGSSFLIMDNRGAELCLRCHESEAAILGSGHDYRSLPEERRASIRFRGESQEERSSCVWCHSTHNAQSEEDMLGLLIPESDVNDQAAQWPANSLEADPENWNQGARHCLACHTTEGDSESVPEAWAHPLDVVTVTGGEGQAPGFAQRVNCRSCHNPHVPEPRQGEFDRAGFLKGSSHQTVCADCHGPKSLWKYGFYHDSIMRVRP